MELESGGGGEHGGEGRFGHPLNIVVLQPNEVKNMAFFGRYLASLSENVKKT